MVQHQLHCGLARQIYMHYRLVQRGGRIPEHVIHPPPTGDDLDSPLTGRIILPAFRRPGLVGREDLLVGNRLRLCRGGDPDRPAIQRADISAGIVRDLQSPNPVRILP
jgi:hypothetical protein